MRRQAIQGACRPAPAPSRHAPREPVEDWLWAPLELQVAVPRHSDRSDREGVRLHPIGTVQPNGQHVQWELINIFRYTDDGRLVEEWVQTDTYDLLRQLDG